ncbi:MAG: hypothetical protein Q9187_007654, partial [Circinaria calcarea]
MVDHDKKGTKDTRLLRDAIPLEKADKAQVTSGEKKPLQSTRPPKASFSVRRIYPKDKRPAAKRELLFLEDLAKGDVKKRADGKDQAKGDHKKPTAENLAPVSTRKPSLLEELFPEDVKKAEKGKKQEEVGYDDVLRVPPLNLDGLLKDFEAGIDTPQVQTQQKLRTREAMLDAFRQQKLTVLVLSRASKSLAESDFRRIAPKGMHIEEWRGPGDILKVIPARDPETLQPQGHYFLVFPNPAYARTYQNHVLHLHDLASTHTPSSLESPMAPPPGMLVQGEDVYTLLQDYALCPPSQRISLRVLQPPYLHGVRKTLQDRGYTALVSPENRSGRSVLFWINGHQPTTFSVKTVLAKDGQERGLQWGPLNGKGSIDLLDAPAGKPENPKGQNPAADEDAEVKSKKHRFSRWVIAFEDEMEARR